MIKGSVCPSHHHMHAATTIRFLCDKSVSGNGTFPCVSPEDSAMTSIYRTTRTRLPASAPGRKVLLFLHRVEDTSTLAATQLSSCLDLTMY